METLIAGDFDLDLDFDLVFFALGGFEVSLIFYFISSDSRDSIYLAMRLFLIFFEIFEFAILGASVSGSIYAS